MKGSIDLWYRSATHELISIPIKHTALTNPLSKWTKSRSGEILSNHQHYSHNRLFCTYELLMVLHEGDVGNLLAELAVSVEGVLGVSSKTKGVPPVYG